MAQMGNLNPDIWEMMLDPEEALRKREEEMSFRQPTTPEEFDALLAEFDKVGWPKTS